MSDEFITDELPAYAVAAVYGDEGATVRYIDTNLQIRESHIGKSKRWFPFFWVQHQKPETMSFLKEAMMKDLPEADEYRVLTCPNRGFFMCAIKSPR